MLRKGRGRGVCIFFDVRDHHRNTPERLRCLDGHTSTAAVEQIFSLCVVFLAGYKHSWLQGFGSDLEKSLSRPILILVRSGTGRLQAEQQLALACSTCDNSVCSIYTDLIPNQRRLTFLSALSLAGAGTPNRQRRRRRNGSRSREIEETRRSACLS